MTPDRIARIGWAVKGRPTKPTLYSFAFPQKLLKHFGELLLFLSMRCANLICGVASVGAGEIDGI